MIYKRSFIILWIGLSGFCSFADPCANEFSAPSDEFQSAGEVFTAYVRSHFGKEGLLDMGSAWMVNIKKYTRHWDVSEAESFLNFLQERIGAAKTRDRLKEPSRLSSMKYGSFVRRVHFYENYIGREGVNKHLSERFRGFDRGNLKRMGAFIRFLEAEFSDSLGKKWIYRNIRENILFAADGMRNEFIKVRAFLNENFGEKFTNKLIQKHPVSFVQARAGELRPVVIFLRGYLKESDVLSVLENNMSVLILTRLSQLEPVVYFLESYIGREEIALKLKDSLSTLRLVRLNQFIPTLFFVEERIGKDLLRKKMIESLQGFNRIKAPQLEELEKLWGRDLMESRLKEVGLRNPIFTRGGRPHQASSVLDEA